MSGDEYDLDELTAFLEEDSDLEDGASEQPSQTTPSDASVINNNDTRTKTEKNDHFSDATRDKSTNFTTKTNGGDKEPEGNLFTKESEAEMGVLSQNATDDDNIFGERKQDLTEAELQALLDDSDLEEPVTQRDTNKEFMSKSLNDQEEKEKKNDISDKEDLAAELARMKEKMRLMEEQLKNHSQATPESVQISEKMKAKPRQLKDLDNNIFFPESGEKGRVVSPKQTLSHTSAKKNVLKKEMLTEEKPDNAETDGKFFPDSDDSDWEGMDGEKSSLSKEGKDIKKLIKTGQRERQAHNPKYDMSAIPKAKESKSWKAAVKSTPDGATSSLPRQVDNDKADSYNGIRVINPLISSSLLKTRMDGRRLIKLSQVHRRVGTREMEGDWVTTGVVVSKSETRLSGNGKNFVIWKLSDLEDCDKIVSFFLFGEVYKHLWKTETGKVIAVLNPSIMPASEKKQNSFDVSFTVDNYQKVMMLGMSKDMGRCRAKTKSGQDCSNFINKSQGEFCTYHVQYGYKKTCSQRVELQASYTGPQPKAYEKKCRQKNEGTYFYGGQTYTTASVKTQKKKDKVSIQTLKQHNMKEGKATTMSFLHPIQPQDEAKLKALSDKQKALHDLISTPSAGALNFVKHLEKKDGIEARAKAEKQNKPIISITPKQLLQQTQREHAERMKRQKNLSCTTGSPQQHVNPLDCVPQLGKGLGDDKGDIFFEDSPTQRPLFARKNDSVAAAKKKALAKVLAKGGLERQDPNAIKKKKSPETLEAKRKRFAMEEANKETGSGENGISTEPPKKRSRLLGDLDPNSEEFKRLMNAKSSHSGAVSEIQMEQQEKYFGELEKREKYEDKMSSTMEVKCSVVVCKQCKYMAQSAADRCKEEGHTLVRKEAMKKFFKCVPCGKRTIAFGMLPTKNCSGCGEFKYEKTSMWKEKKGPLLDSEKLLLRGVEEKFLR